MAYLEQSRELNNAQCAEREENNDNEGKSNLTNITQHPLHSLQHLFQIISSAVHGLNEVSNTNKHSLHSHNHQKLFPLSRHGKSENTCSFITNKTFLNKANYNCGKRTSSSSSSLLSLKSRNNKLNQFVPQVACHTVTINNNNISSNINGYTYIELERELYEYATFFDDVQQILCATSSSQLATPKSIMAESSSAMNITHHSPFYTTIPLDKLEFKLIALDRKYGIELYSSPLPHFPVYLMCGYAMMPCSSTSLLYYMSSEIRPKWDRYTKSCRVIRSLPPPLQQKAWEEFTTNRKLSFALTTSHTPLTPTSKECNRGNAVNDTNNKDVIENRSNGNNKNKNTERRYQCYCESRKDTYPILRPGQKRVSVQHLCVASPVLFVQDREFELVVGEEVKDDGTTFIKAFSPPLGFAVPLDPQQRKYVRGVSYLTAAIAKPLLVESTDELPAGLRDDINGCISHSPSMIFNSKAASTTLKHKSRMKNTKTASANASALSSSSCCSSHVTSDYTHKNDEEEYESEEEQEEEEQEQEQEEEEEEEMIDSTCRTANATSSFCLVGYVGLVHPMGLVPPVITNLVISAQLSSLRRLQQFILRNPLPETTTTTTTESSKNKMNTRAHAKHSRHHTVQNSKNVTNNDDDGDDNYNDNEDTKSTTLSKL